MSQDPEPRIGRRLQSWKEIAAYLQKDARTVQRWEKSEGLPVHRHGHQTQATIYANSAELDVWLASRSKKTEQGGSFRRLLTLRVLLAVSASSVLLTAGLIILDRIAAGGGAPTAATRLNSARHEITHRYPQFLPDGRHFIYWAWSALEENTGIYAGSLDPKEKLPEGPLVRTWREARFAEPGYLLFLQGSRLVAQQFDTVRLRLTGEPHSLHELVGMHWARTGQAMFSVSPSGVLAYQEAAPLPDTRIVWRDRAGKQLRSIEAPQASSAYQHSLAPDEKRIAVTTDDENTLEDLWVVDLERATSLRLTATHGSSCDGVWSPDGRRIAFRSNRTGVYDLYGKDANGVGDEEVLVKSPHYKIPEGWSPDGRFLVYDEFDPKTQVDIWIVPLEGDRKPFPFLKTEFNEHSGRLWPVPDSQGRLWMAYSSDETGQGEIYLRPLLRGAPGGSAQECGSRLEMAFVRNGARTAGNCSTPPTTS